MSVTVTDIQQYKHLYKDMKSPVFRLKAKANLSADQYQKAFDVYEHLKSNLEPIDAIRSGSLGDGEGKYNYNDGQSVLGGITQIPEEPSNLLANLPFAAAEGVLRAGSGIASAGAGLLDAVVGDANYQDLSREDIKTIPQQLGKSAYTALDFVSDELRSASKGVGARHTVDMDDVNITSLSGLKNAGVLIAEEGPASLGEAVLGGSQKKVATAVLSGSIIGNTAADNAENKGDNTVTASALFDSLPYSAGSVAAQVISSRFGGSSEGVKGALKALGIGAVSEGTQEGLEYVGGINNTNVEYDSSQFWNSVKAGAVVGGPMDASFHVADNLMSNRQEAPPTDASDTSPAPINPTPNDTSPVDAEPVNPTDTVTDPVSTGFLSSRQLADIGNQNEGLATRLINLQDVLQNPDIDAETRSGAQAIYDKAIADNDLMNMLQPKVDAQPVIDTDLLNTSVADDSLIDTQTIDTLDVSRLPTVESNEKVGEESYVTIANKRVPTQLKIVEAGSLAPDVAGTENQFRDRNRKASLLQVNSIANNLDPRQLEDTSTLSTGAPTLAADGSTIIAGNGRSKALQQAYAEGNANEYKDSLIKDAARYGVSSDDVASMENPVLVRQLKQEVDVQKAAIESNETSGLAMSAMEQARADSVRLPDLSAVNFNADGDINHVGNRSVIQQFVQALPTEARAGVVTSQGMLSQEGERRVQNAILYKAYGDTHAIADMIENPNATLKNAVKSSVNIAPTVAATKDGINQGVLTDADISSEITDALLKLQQLRNNNMTVADYLAQQGLFEDGLSPISRDLIQYIDDNIRSAKAITELLITYYDNLNMLGNPQQDNLLGDASQVDRQALFNQTLSEVKRAREQRDQQPARKTTDLFSGSTAANDTAKTVSTAATSERLAASVDTGSEQRPAESASNEDGVGANEESVDIISNSKESDTTTDDIRYSKNPNEPKDLVVAHNITSKGVIAANDLGGLAAPSIAVVRSGVSDFSSYGEISLLADPTLLASKDMPTFDADIYSPRQPRPIFNINEKRFRDFEDGLSGAKYKLRAPTISDLSEGADRLLRSEAVQYEFLKSIGKDPKLKNAKVDPAIKAAAKIDLRRQSATDNSKFLAAATKYFESQMQDTMEKMVARAKLNGEDVTSDEDIHFIRSIYFNADGSITHDQLDRFIDRVNRHKQSDGKDYGQFSKDLTEKMRSNLIQRRFEMWVTDKFNNLVDGKVLFKGFTPGGSRRYKPYNLENVVKEMTEKLNNGENFSYGAGSVRSVYANELKTLKDIQARRDKIIPKDDFLKIKEESNQVFEDALENLKPFYKFDADSWNYADDAANAIAEGRAGIREAFGASKEAKKIIDDLTYYLSNLPTEYFEAKAQRAMQFSEFQVAVVPKNADPEAVQILRDAGVTIRRYDNKVEGDRSRVIANQKRLLFSKNNDQAQPVKTTQVEKDAVRESVENAIGKSRTNQIEFRDKPDKNDTHEGQHNRTTGETVVFLDNISSLYDSNGNEVLSKVERATWVAWHEAFHRGMSVIGDTAYRKTLIKAKKNPYVAALAKAIQTKNPSYSDDVAIEEALADTRAALDTDRFDIIETQYGVKQPRSKSGMHPIIKRWIDTIRQTINQLLGRETVTTDDQVIEIVRSISKRDSDVMTGDADQQLEPSMLSEPVPEGNGRFSADNENIFYSQALDDSPFTKKKDELIDSIRKARPVQALNDVIDIANITLGATDRGKKFHDKLFDSAGELERIANRYGGMAQKVHRAFKMVSAKTQEELRANVEPQVVGIKNKLVEKQKELMETKPEYKGQNGGALLLERIDEIGKYYFHGKERNLTMMINSGGKDNAGSGKTNAEIDALIADYDKNHPELVEFYRDLYESNIRPMIDYKTNQLLEANLLTQSQIDAQYDWKWYVPLKGEGREAVLDPVTGKIIDDRRMNEKPINTKFFNPFNRLGNKETPAATGRHGTEAEHILQSVFIDAQIAVQRKYMQEPKKALLEYVQTKEGAKAYGSQKSPAKWSRVIGTKQFDVNQDGKLIVIKKEMEVKEKTVVYRDGDATYLIDISNDKAANAMLNITNAFGDGVWGDVGRTFSKLTRLNSSVWTRFSLSFQVNNKIRDAKQHYALLLADAPVGNKTDSYFVGENSAVANLKRRVELANKAMGLNAKYTTSLASIVAGNPSEAAQEYEMYLDMLRKEGGVTTYSQLLRGDVLMNLEREIAKSLGGGQAVAKQVQDKTVEFFDAVSDNIELTSRVAIFKSLIDAGVDKTEAAIYTKDTMNFETRGEWGQFIGSIWAFAPSIIYDVKRTSKALFNTKEGHLVFAAFFIFKTMMLALADMLGEDDEDGIPFIDKIPFYQAMGYDTMIFGERGEGIKVPHGWGVSRVAAGSAVVARRLANGTMTTAEAAEHMAMDVVMGTFSPIQIKSVEGDFLNRMFQTGMPTVTVPMIQIMTNTSFTGSSVYKDPAFKKKGYLEYESGYDWTEDTYKMMAKMLNHSSFGSVDAHPETIKLYARSYVPMATEMAQITEAIIDGAQGNTDTAMTGSGLPIASKFLSFPPRYDQRIYSQNRKKLESYQDKMLSYERNGNEGKAKKYRELEVERWIKKTQAIKKSVKVLDNKSEAYKKKYDGNELITKLRELEDEERKLMARFNKEWSEWEKSID